jgi:hypothetical protein
LCGEMVANEASCLTVSVWICCKVTKSDLQWFNPGQFSVQYSAPWLSLFRHRATSRVRSGLKLIYNEK